MDFSKKTICSNSNYNLFKIKCKIQIKTIHNTKKNYKMPNKNVNSFKTI